MSRSRFGSEKRECLNPIATQNTHPIKERTVTNTPELDSAKERVSRVFDAMPSDLKPPCIRTMKGISVVNNERLFAFLPEGDFGRYMKRIGQELQTGNVKYNVFFHDFRSGQSAIPAKPDPDFLFYAMGLAIAELNSWVIRRPSKSALTESLGFPGDRSDLTDLFLERTRILLKSILGIRNGSILFKNPEGALKMQFQPGPHMAKEMYNIAFTSYMCFIDYCQKNGGEYPPNDLTRLVEAFCESSSLKDLAVPEELHLLLIWNRVKEGDSIENVLRELRNMYSASTPAQKAESLTALAQHQRFYESISKAFVANDMIAASLQYVAKTIPSLYKFTIAPAIEKALAEHNYSTVLRVLYKILDYETTQAPSRLFGVDGAVFNAGFSLEETGLGLDEIATPAMLLNLMIMDVYDKEDQVKLARDLLLHMELTV